MIVLLTIIFTTLLTFSTFTSTFDFDECIVCKGYYKNWTEIFRDPSYQETLIRNVTDTTCTDREIQRHTLCVDIVQKLYSDNYQYILDMLDSATPCGNCPEERQKYMLQKDTKGHYQEAALAKDCIVCTEIVKEFCVYLNDKEHQAKFTMDVQKRYCSDENANENVTFPILCEKMVNEILTSKEHRSGFDRLLDMTRDSRALCAALNACDSKARIIISDLLIIVSIIAFVYYFNYFILKH